MERLIFRIADTLRGYLSSEKIAVVTLTLLFHKRVSDIREEFRPDDMSRKLNISLFPENDPAEFLIESFKYQIFEEKGYHQLLNFIPKLYEELKVLPDRVILEILCLINTLNLRQSAIDHEEFGAFFNNMIRKLVKVNSPFRQHSSTNEVTNVLSDLLLSVIDTNYPTILDPAFGYCSLLAECSKKIKNVQFFGFEKQSTTYAIGLMNMLSHGITDIHFSNTDALFTDNNIKVDYAIADLPLGLKVRKQEIMHSPIREYAPFISSSGTSLFLQLMLSSISENGKVVSLIPDSFLFGQAEKKFREYLLHKNLIDTVINLPKGILRPYTSANVSIIILNKQRGNNKDVLFIDGRLSGESVTKLYESARSGYISNCCSLIGVNNILSEQSDLLKVLIKTKQSKIADNDQETVVLSSVLRRAPRKKRELIELNIPLVSAKDLSSSPLDAYINLGTLDSTLTESVENYIGYKFYKNNGFIIDRTGHTPKVGIINDAGHGYLLAPKIDCYEFDETRLDPEFLAYQIFTDNFQDQWKAYSTGGAFRTISSQVLELITIKLPALKDQRDYVETRKREIIESKEQEIAYLKRDISQKVDKTEFELISSLKHKLSQKLGALSSGIGSLEYYLITKSENGGNVKLDEPIVPPLLDEPVPENELVGNFLKSLKRITKEASDTINRYEKTIREGTEITFQKVDIIKFFRSEVLPTLMPPKDIKIKINPLNKNEVHASIDKFLMIEVTRNMLDNIDRHGRDEENQRRVINFIIDISEDLDQNKVLIIFKNDGKPIKTNVDNLFSYGETAGKTANNGLGLYEIKKDVEAMNGSIVFNGPENELDPFHVKFEISLPINI